jgi:peptidoglycan/xylan/chitin deacetylase (PgdA/CDA1 family)
MYHSINIGKESLYFNVLPNDFEWQIKYLKEREFSFVSMDEIYLYLSGQLKLKPKSVCITFDDGYKDNLTQALPILEKYKIPAIIYIATDYIDRGLGAKELPTCTWDDIKYLHSHSLITIGGHTINHKRLNELEPEEAFNEIDEGKKILERKIGGKVNHFAYPKGLYGPKTPSLVKKAGYLTAVTVSPGLLSLQKNPDLFLLPRIPIDKSMDNQSFQLANRMGAGIYYDLRKFFKGN